MGCCKSKNEEVNWSALQVQTFSHGVVEVDMVSAKVKDRSVLTSHLRHKLEERTGVLSCLQVYFFDGVRTDLIDLRQLSAVKRPQMIAAGSAQTFDVKEGDLRKTRFYLKKTGVRTVERLLFDITQVWTDLQLGSFVLCKDEAELSPSTLLSTLPDNLTLTLKVAELTQSALKLPFAVAVSRIGATTAQAMVGAKTTCAMIKRQLEGTVGLPASKQRLIHKGRELDDDDNLVIDGGVTPDSKLHVIAKLSLEAWVRRLDATSLPTSGSAEIEAAGEGMQKVFAGVNWIATCSSKSCGGQVHIIRGGYGVFDINEVNQSLVCPQCRGRVDNMKRAGFYGSAWRSVKNVKPGCNSTSEGTTDWGLFMFWSELHMTEWVSMKLEVKPFDLD
jgi:hypothetical protein